MYTYFNPRTSCEVRLIRIEIDANDVVISIHAPRVRCDLPVAGNFIAILEFQSTHLV